jgi:hypothetical protein
MSSIAREPGINKERHPIWTKGPALAVFLFMIGRVSEVIFAPSTEKAKPETTPNADQNL